MLQPSQSPKEIDPKSAIICLSLSNSNTIFISLFVGDKLSKKNRKINVMLGVYGVRAQLLLGGS